MKTLIIVLCVSLFSGAGWWLGEGFGPFSGYFLSFSGSLLGVYVGVIIGREYLP